MALVAASDRNSTHYSYFLPWGLLTTKAPQVAKTLLTPQFYIILFQPLGEETLIMLSLIPCPQIRGKGPIGLVYLIAHTWIDQLGPGNKASK